MQLSTFSGGLNLGGMLSEEVNIVVGKLSDNSTIKLEDGMVHYFTVAETTSPHLHLHLVILSILLLRWRLEKWYQLQ